jgi:hypothetical protein
MLATVIVLLAMITTVSMPVFAGGGSSEEDRPLRLYATALHGPIGSTQSLHSIKINGQNVVGQQPIWGGELIEVVKGESARLQIDSLGEIVLKGDTAVRVSSTSGSAGRVLIASLVKGDISIRLRQEGAAYLEAGGKKFSADTGSSFRVSMRSGNAVLSESSGSVRVDQTSQANYKIRVVDELGRPVDLGRTLSVRARSTRQFQIQVTDENDRPVPDLPILFSLSDPCIGSLGLGAGAVTSLKKETDDKGIAVAPFVVGAARCLASITAKIEGTSVSVTQQVQASPRSSFWSPRNSLLVAAAAGAAVGTTLAVTANDGGEEILPVPPPRVTP